MYGIAAQVSQKLDSKCLISKADDALTAAFAEDFSEKPCSATKVASILKASVADGTVVKEKTKIDKSERTTYALAE